MTTKNRKRRHAVLAGSVNARHWLERTYGVPTVGEILAAHRDQNALSQAELARCLGVSRQNLCDIEKGRAPVSVGRALKFSAILGGPNDYFVHAAVQEELRRVGSTLTVKVA
jgi:DNA-binding XRE family transcriptional regulator